MTPPWDHQQVQDHLADYLADVLPATERQALRDHLRQCAACQAELAEVRDIQRLLRGLRADAPARPRSIADAVLARLDAPHSSQSAVDRPVSPNGHVLGASSNSTTVQWGARAAPVRQGVFAPMEPSQPTPSQSQRRPVALISGAVAALLVIAAIAVFALRQPTPMTHPFASFATPTPLASPTSDPRPRVTPSANKTPLIQMKSYRTTIAGPSPSAPVTPQNESSIFLINRFIYIIGNTNDQTKADDIISIKWYFNGVDATASIQKTAPKCCEFALTPDKAGKQSQVLFQLAVPVATHGKVEIYYNGQLAYTLLFDVVDVLSK